VIGSKDVYLCGNSDLLPEGVESIKVCDQNRKSETIQEIYNAIKEQSGLFDKDVFAILKQFLLGYRGQSGQVEAQFLVSLPLSEHIQGSFTVRTDLPPETPVDLRRLSQQENPPCVMNFRKNGSGVWELKSKTESTQMLGIYRCEGSRMVPLTEGVIFGFPQDGIVRENGISIVSDLENGQFRSLPRENPPREVTFFGGCTPAGAH
jgi:hypothetical protein